jgi:hypothetical protein
MAIAYVVKGNGYYIDEKGAQTKCLFKAKFYSTRPEAISEIRAAGERSVEVEIKEVDAKP